MIKLRKLFLIVIFCFSISVLSQDITAKYRFIKENIPILDYDLNIETDYSLFYESGYCLKDLVSKSDLIIYKDNSTNIKLLDKVGEVAISTNKPDKLDWIIKKDKKVIGGHNCQQAEVIYKNQKWIAWFSNDLPVQDGPFIFKGLPGLILMIENDHYKFELLEIRKSKKECSPVIENRKEISYEKYESLFNGISKKNDALLNSLSNLNLKLETKLESIGEKEKKINSLREIL